jgi:hypothetical protein
LLMHGLQGAKLARIWSTADGLKRGSITLGRKNGHQIQVL